MPTISKASALANMGSNMNKKNSNCFFIVICFKLYINVCLNIQKENVDNLLRLRSRGIAKHLYCLNESIAHAIRRELQLQILQYSLKFGEFREQESKSGYSSYMSLMLAHRDFSYFFLQPIGICGFKGLDIFIT